MADLRILGFAGSLRRGSYNRALLRAAVELAPPGMAVETFDLREIPLYDGDVEAEGDPPGVKANLARILCTGRLGGTGKVVILPVDQGFEHGPARSFAPNPPAYDPHYHYQLAIEAGVPAVFARVGAGGGFSVSTTIPAARAAGG